LIEPAAEKEREMLKREWEVTKKEENQ